MSEASREAIRHGTPLSEVMRRPVISIQIDEPAGLADTLMQHHAVHHIPVLEGDVLRGIISQSDLYKNMLSVFFIDSEREQQAFLDEFLDLPSIMTPDPISLTPGDTVGQALALMLEHRISSIPVVSGQNELLGIVTQFDLLAGFRDLLERER